MADQHDARDPAILKQQIAELESRLRDVEGQLHQERARSQLVRQETIDWMKNTTAEQLRVLEEDATRNRTKLLEARTMLAHCSALVAASLLREKQMIVEPLWSPYPALGIESNVVYLLMPFEPAWADEVCAKLRDALSTVAMRCVRADETARIGMRDIWTGICGAALVVADLTDANANVTHEIGLADAVGKHVVLISQTEPRVLPFDFRNRTILVYSTRSLDVMALEVLRRIRALRDARPTP